MPAFATTYEARRLTLETPDFHAAHALTHVSGSRSGGQQLQLPAIVAPSQPFEPAEAYSEWYSYMRGNPLGPSIQTKSHLQQHQQSAMPQYAVQQGYYGSEYGQRQMDYGPVGAPVLPSIRADPRLADYDMAPPPYQAVGGYGPVGQQQQQQQPVQDERVSSSSGGGVAAVLDYDVEMMAEFAAGMAQYIVKPKVPVSPAFRKFISQLLHATRLPSPTVLLALYYMEGRMQALLNQDLRLHAAAEVYRMITVGMMIASKYLDDNTFHNRSWADVSGIHISELNVMEHVWLVGAEWKMHVNPDDQLGYLRIVDRWHRWSSPEETAARAAATAPPRMQLPPIDTSGMRYRGSGAYHHHDTSSALPSYDAPFPGQLASYSSVGGRDGRNGSYASTSSAYPGHYGSFSSDNGYHHDHGSWGYSRGPVVASPPSAPETGPATPDYLNYPGAWSYNFVQPSQSYHHQQQHQQQQSHSTMLPAIRCPTDQECLPSYRQTPYGTNHPDYNYWNAHPVGCRCAHCLRRYESYPAMTAYAA